jgi:CyaY protein
MIETEFLALADTTLREIERAIEVAATNLDLDIECSFSGNVLEIEFIDQGSKIIVNSQAPMQEIWVAAKSGGFHFKRRDNQWVDTRDDTELFAALSRIASAQAGKAITLAT